MIQFFLPMFVGGTLFFSGLQKIPSPMDLVDTIRAFRLPNHLQRRLVAYAVIYIEVAIGLGVLFGSGILKYICILAAAIIFCLFTFLIAVALGRGERVACNCFGDISKEVISKRTLIRNILFLLSSIMLLIVAQENPVGFDSLEIFKRIDFRNLSSVLLTACLVAIIVRIVNIKSASLVSAAAENDPENSFRSETLIGSMIPKSELRTSTDKIVNLKELVTGEAQLMLFVQANCVPCHEVLNSVADVKKQFSSIVNVKVISISSYTEFSETHSAESKHALYDGSGMLATILGLRGTPCSLLIGTDGKIAAGPAYGTEEIFALNQSILDAISLQYKNYK